VAVAVAVGALGEPKMSASLGLPCASAAADPSITTPALTRPK